MSDFLNRLGLHQPIMLAPLGGGPSTPELVAAVSHAGGMGFLASAYLTPDQIVSEGARIRTLTDRPFGTNLFAGAWDQQAQGDAAGMLSLLGEVHRELGLAPPHLPTLPPNPFPAQLDSVIALRPALFTFIFGIPSEAELARVKQAGIAVAGTATTIEEALLLRQAGVDAIVAQGAEAGAHRGTFLRPWEESLVPLRELVPAIRGETSLPVIAAGGLMDGRDVADILALGATAAALGTAFLVTPESGAAPAYKQALLAGRGDQTVITRAFSGRPARGLRNDFIARADPSWILPYPLQNALTREMRGAAGKQGKADYLSLWAGTSVDRARPLPAAELMRTLIAELEAAQDK
jgi:nitronate monooxygenase